MNKHIRYSSGWKFKLEEPHSQPTGVVPAQAISTSFVSLDATGTIYIRAEYAWNGASGPAPDVESSKRATLVHDALYGLISAGVLGEEHKARADALLYEMLVEDGMWPAFAHVWLWAVTKFGLSYIRAPKRIYTAPPL